MYAGRIGWLDPPVRFEIVPASKARAVEVVLLHVGRHHEALHRVRRPRKPRPVHMGDHQTNEFGPRPLWEMFGVYEQAYVAIGFLTVLVGGERASQNKRKPL